MFREKEIEIIAKKDLIDYQVRMLNQSINQAAKSEYYKGVFGDRIPEISSPEDMKKLPFTTKEDMRGSFPYGLLSIDKSRVVRLHSSSGTTGNPTVVYHTREDLDQWANLVARCMYMVGVRETDVFQNIMGYGLFTGGLGFHYGAEKLGVMTIPIGPGNSKRQIWFMREFGTTVVHILPSYALRLYTHFTEMGLDPKKDTKLRTAFIGAEPHTESVRKKIEELYGIKAYNSYGLSEMNGPGVAFECQEQDGMHVWEDGFYAEIIDPVTGEVLPDGEQGELVLTTLKRTAMPVIRYRTRDLTRIIKGGCKCGRTHKRIDRIKGRSDDMLIINGVNIFPMQIESIITKYPESGHNYVIEIKKENFMDKVIVKIEINERMFDDSFRQIEHLQKRMAEDLKNELGINPIVYFVQPESLPQSEGKAQRVCDLRNKE
jgi:phenylacetate-CoA ligase